MTSAELDQRLPAVLAIRCPTCNSKPGEKCASLITAQYRDEVHAARRERAKESR